MHQAVSSTKFQLLSNLIISIAIVLALSTCGKTDEVDPEIEEAAVSIRNITDEAFSDPDFLELEGAEEFVKRSDENLDRISEISGDLEAGSQRAVAKYLKDSATNTKTFLDASSALENADIFEFSSMKEPGILQGYIQTVQTYVDSSNNIKTFMTNLDGYMRKLLKANNVSDSETRNFMSGFMSSINTLRPSTDKIYTLHADYGIAIVKTLQYLKLNNDDWVYDPEFDYVTFSTVQMQEGFDNSLDKTVEVEEYFTQQLPIAAQEFFRAQASLSQ